MFKNVMEQIKNIGWTEEEQKKYYELRNAYARDYYNLNRERLLKVQKQHPEYHKAYREKHREELKMKAKLYYLKNKEIIKLRSKNYRKQFPQVFKEYRKNHLKEHAKTECEHHKLLKNLVFTHYGWKCACCGESEPEFLSIDHINGDGHKHRSKNGLKSSGQFYWWIVKNNYPIDLQTLCFNCNHAKGCHGKDWICPHKRNKIQEETPIAIKCGGETS